MLYELVIVRNFGHYPFGVEQVTFIPGRCGTGNVKLFLSKCYGLCGIIRGRPRLSRGVKALRVVGTQVRRLTRLLVSLRSGNCDNTY